MFLMIKLDLEKVCIFLVLDPGGLSQQYVSHLFEIV